MNPLKSAELRRRFLSYFEQRGHEILKSAPLIPRNDPTLMFTTAGMVQFKDVFKGLEARPYTRATSAQKCLRVSGKQNDLEEVGRTARHHTFFEMLGNFSFGDYFRAEAIDFAWEFLTRELKIPTDKLWITVFGGGDALPPDDQARELWRKVSGFPDERIVGLGMKDNFWAMGDTGPCGVTSEIFFDLGSGPVTLDDFENGRIVEIWNLVFLNFDRQADGSLASLPKPCIDTGMGIERLACLMQGETSNFHTDLFMPLLERTSEIAGKHYCRSGSEDDVSMRVIADHARAITFLVADGVQPSKDGRGYVMRRIMRRAIRHGKRLGLEELFLHRVCEVVVETMGDTHPELREARGLIGKVVELEEKTFRRTLDTGLILLEGEIRKTKAGGILDGSSVFKLYDTYGFPKDLTQVIAAERGLEIDEEGFAREMAAQQERSRGSAVGEAEVATIYKELRDRCAPVDFVGYAHEDEPIADRDGAWRVRSADGGEGFLETSVEVCAVVQEGAEVASADGGEVELVLQPTPFYGKSGGQHGDTGLVVDDGGLKLEVIEAKKPFDDLTVVRVRVVSGEVRPGMKVWAGYRPSVRMLTRAHHSATHLLHSSLRKVLGDHVQQAGSLVDADHLRFDFAHFEAPSADQLLAVEDDVNARITVDADAVTEVLPFDRAKEKGAISLFGEKYGDMVRVVSMGDSIEFCGGTHVRRTSDIGLFLITREEAVASGVRRIEAKVGASAERALVGTLGCLEHAAALISGGDVEPGDDAVLQSMAAVARDYREIARELGEVGESVEPATRTVAAPSLPAQWTLAKGRRIRELWRGLTRLANAKGSEAEAIAEHLASIDDEGVLAAFAHLIASNRAGAKRLDRLRSTKLSSRAGDLLDQVRDVGGLKRLAAKVPGVDGKALRELSDQLRAKVGSGVICLFTDNEGKAFFLISVTKDLTPDLSAGDLAKRLAPIIGGRGGGKPELAQGGGDKPEAAEALFDELARQLEARRVN